MTFAVEQLSMALEKSVRVRRLCVILSPASEQMLPPCRSVGQG